MNERQQSVDCVRVSRFRRLDFLEFPPQPHPFLALVFRQHAEQAVRRRPLSLRFIFVPDGIIGERIAGVHFDDIVHEQHADYPVQIRAGRCGILVHQHGEYRDVPTVLGRILPAASVQNQRLAQHALELVDLSDECDLPR